MDYEKKYKEALEKARQLCAYPTSKPFISDLQDIFPELKESEGEQHRKWILEYLYDGLRKSDEQFKDHFKAAIAWIEKQGEQIPNYCHHEVDLSECSEEYRKAYYDGWNNCNQQRAQLEAEKKPADKVEPKFKVGDKIRRKTTSSCDKDMQVARIEKDYYICNHIGKFSSEVVPFSKQSSYELIEQNPAETEKGEKGNDREIPNSDWSEEDESVLFRTINDLKFLRDTISIDPKYAVNIIDIEREITWLKNLKDRVQPQNLTVTDEELAQAKKDAYNDALDKIEYHSGEPTFDDGWNAAIWYLKIRNVQPQNTWKPSDEQIDALNDVISSRDIKYDVLSELWKDLKKLREE